MSLSTAVTQTEWDAAYTHASLVAGNPHVVTKAEVGLGSVENTALSTWAGTTNVTTLGTIATGTWSATAVAVAKGGTGATDAATARTNLGLAIGSNVQAYSANLGAIAALAVTDSNFIVGNGATWVAEGASTARTSLGLGTMATQAASSVAITGGTFAGITDTSINNNIPLEWKDSGGTDRSILQFGSDNVTRLGNQAAAPSNGHILFFANGVDIGRFIPGGNFQVNNLAGSGDRAVCADASGALKICP